MASQKEKENDEVSQAIVMAMDNIFHEFNDGSVEDLHESAVFVKGADRDKVLEMFVAKNVISMIRKAKDAAFMHKIMAVFVKSELLSLNLFQKILAVVTGSPMDDREAVRKVVFEFIESPNGPFEKGIYLNVLAKATTAGNVAFLELIDNNKEIKLIGELTTNELLNMEQYRVQCMKETNTETEPREYELATQIIRRNSVVQTQ